MATYYVRQDGIEYLSPDEMADIETDALVMGWDVRRIDRDRISVTWNKDQPEPDVYTRREVDYP